MLHNLLHTSTHSCRDPTTNSRSKPGSNTTTAMTKTKAKQFKATKTTTVSASAAPASLPPPPPALLSKAQAIHRLLDQLYPNPPIPLDHFDNYSLLIAVILSAQTTDGKVRACGRIGRERGRKGRREGGREGCLLGPLSTGSTGDVIFRDGGGRG